MNIIQSPMTVLAHLRQLPPKKPEVLFTTLLPVSMVVPANKNQAALYNDVSGRSCIPETDLNHTRHEFDEIEIADNLKGIPWHR